mgnify:CR=1 FL=1
MSKSKWPFREPPNEATITVRQIVEGGLPILMIARDAEEGGWQFLTGGEFNMDDGMVVGLQEMWEIDPTIAEVAGLKPGWEACRERVGGPWRRSEQEDLP